MPIRAYGQEQSIFF